MKHFLGVTKTPVLELKACLSLQPAFQKWREGSGSGCFSKIIRGVKELGPAELDYRRRQTEKRSAEYYYRQELCLPFLDFLMSDLKERFADATLQVVHLIKLLPVYLVTNSVEVKDVEQTLALFSEILSDANSVKATSAPIYTYFEGERMPKKCDFLVKKF